MNPPRRALVLALAALCMAGFARAEDRVSIRYTPGYPLPARSSERIELRVERSGPAPAMRAEDQEVDRFFALVQATLSDSGIARDWQSVIPDAPWIEITVELNGQRTRLASAHVPLERTGNRVVTERGVEPLGERTREAVLAQQSEAHRRHRVAFDRLLALTLARVRAQLAP